MSDQNLSQQQLIARAMKDEAFRQRLLDNPKTVLERDLGITFPQGVTIQVHEDTPTALHLVLPSKPQTDGMVDLSDAELERVAGGLSAMCVTENGGVQAEAGCNQ